MKHLESIRLWTFEPSHAQNSQSHTVTEREHEKQLRETQEKINELKLLISEPSQSTDDESTWKQANEDIAKEIDELEKLVNKFMTSAKERLTNLENTNTTVNTLKTAADSQKTQLEVVRGITDTHKTQIENLQSAVDVTKESLLNCTRKLSALEEKVNEWHSVTQTESETNELPKLLEAATAETTEALTEVMESIKSLKEKVTELESFSFINTEEYKTLFNDINELKSSSENCLKQIEEINKEISPVGNFLGLRDFMDSYWELKETLDNLSIEEIEERVTKLETVIGNKLEASDLDSLVDSIDAFDLRVGNFESNLDSKLELSDLEEIETKITDLETDLDEKVELADLDAINTSLTNLQNSLAKKLELTDLTTLNTGLTNLQTRIAEGEGSLAKKIELTDLASLNTSITNITTSLNKVKNQLEEKINAIGPNEEKLEDLIKNTKDLDTIREAAVANNQRTIVAKTRLDNLEQSLNTHIEAYDAAKKRIEALEVLAPKTIIQILKDPTHAIRRSRKIKLLSGLDVYYFSTAGLLIALKIYSDKKTKVFIDDEQVSLAEPGDAFNITLRQEVTAKTSLHFEGEDSATRFYCEAIIQT